jgi:cell division inhibitor SulA
MIVSLQLVCFVCAFSDTRGSYVRARGTGLTRVALIYSSSNGFHSHAVSRRAFRHRHFHCLTGNLHLGSEKTEIDDRVHLYGAICSVFKRLCRNAAFLHGIILDVRMHAVRFHATGNATWPRSCMLVGYAVSTIPKAARCSALLIDICAAIANELGLQSKWHTWITPLTTYFFRSISSRIF